VVIYFNDVFSTTTVNSNNILRDDRCSYLLLTDCSFPSVMKISDASEHDASCSNCPTHYRTCWWDNTIQLWQGMAHISNKNQ